MTTKKSTWYIHGDTLRNEPAVYAALVSLDLFADSPEVIRVAEELYNGCEVLRFALSRPGNHPSVIESQKLLKDERLTGLVVCWDTSEDAQRMVERAQYLGAAVVQLIEPDHNADRNP